MDVAKLSKSPKEGLRKAKSLSSPLRTTVKTRLGPDSDASHGAAATASDWRQPRRASDRHGPKNTTA